jgi:hypothetical protein
MWMNVKDIRCISVTNRPNNKVLIGINEKASTSTTSLAEAEYKTRSFNICIKKREKRLTVTVVGVD